MHTNFSSVVLLVVSASLKKRSHFQKMMTQIGNFLILITLGLVLLIAMASLFRHASILEIARFALVLTVAAITVALPAVLSVTMAVGAANMARRQAIVSRLTAIEELAGVDIFCSDKIGTLTKNEMKVADPLVLDGYNERDLFLYATLASKLENSDPIELPIFHYIDEHFPDLDWRVYRQTQFTPFDPIRKRTDAAIENKGEEHFVVVKGATQVLLEMAQLSDDETHNIQNMVDLLASKGYRTLAVGHQQGDAPLVVLGLIPLYDPPRDDSLQVIAEMRDYGIQVKMIAGDNLAIAKEVGRQLNLEQHTIRSVQLSRTAGNELLALVEALTTVLYQRIKGEVSLKEAKRFASEVMAEAPCISIVVASNFKLVWQTKKSAKFTQTFKIEAVKQAFNRTKSKSLVETTEFLGVGYSTRQRWITQSKSQEFESATENKLSSLAFGRSQGF